MEVKSPFDFIKSINEKYSVDFEQAQSNYAAFIINRAFSNTQDTVFFANEMNKMHFLDKDQQYDFYYNGIPKGKRFGKFNKSVKATEDELMLQEHFCINILRAREYLQILSPEQLNIIRIKCSRGGAK